LNIITSFGLITNLCLDISSGYSASAFGISEFVLRETHSSFNRNKAEQSSVRSTSRKEAQQTGIPAGRLDAGLDTDTAGSTGYLILAN
jgi:hypothetical protein